MKSATTPRPKIGASTIAGASGRLARIKPPTKSPKTVAHTAGSMAISERPKNPFNTTRRSAGVHGLRASELVNA